MEYVKLYNGLTMPIFGIGTYLLSPDEAKSPFLLRLNAVTDL